MVWGLIKGLLWRLAFVNELSTRVPSIQLQLTAQPTITISSNWEILGPFQIGTREATWGADPLEYSGGFRSLRYSKEDIYRSSLGVNGTVGWSVTQAENLKECAITSEAKLSISFPDTDWSFLQSIYGWAAFQYQGWARGQLEIAADRAQTIVLYTDNILEFWVDNVPYFGGDFYAYRRSPLVIQLDPGSHKLDLRIVRDVRSMGGGGSPEVEVKLKAKISNGGISISKEKLLLPEIVEGKLASHLASLPIRNEDQSWIEVRSIESLNDFFVISMLQETPLTLAPGQSRALTFHVTLSNHGSSCISLRLIYVIRGTAEVLHSPAISSTLSLRNITEPHRVTFLHPGGIVSYAILIAPRVTSLPEATSKPRLPVLVSMHGAGLEADSEQVRHMLDSVLGLSTWILFPTGVTPWSGDDWHTWGFADVQAAIAVIPRWIETMCWRGPQVEIKKILVNGHSNGGQGTWFTLTHHPDLVIAAAPVSGYSSIQTYVPYNFWQEADPRIAMLLQTSLVSYRHELFTENFAGIPILQQHGNEDDNVPVYHSRHMQELISQSGWLSNYVELPGKGHWFEGVMTTRPLQAFYESVLKTDSNVADLPEIFKFVVPGTTGMSSRGGIVVDQVSSPDQLGSVEVVQDKMSSTWILKTSNILRFHFSREEWSGRRPAFVKIDSSHNIAVEASDGLFAQSFVQLRNSSWMGSFDQSWQTKMQRYGNQLGALESILRTRGHFLIRYSNSTVHKAALQIGRNLYQYFAADAEIVQFIDNLGLRGGNVITISIGLENWSSTIAEHPIKLKEGVGITVRDSRGYIKSYPCEAGLGAIFLNPMTAQRLELVVWGFDISGLNNAARLVPMLTGVGQPDFVIVSKASAWKGAAGVLAMGLFDHDWNLSRASFMS